MSAKFLEGVGGKLAEQWVANLLTPAFVFWSGGLLAYIYRHGWQPIANLFPDSKLEALQIGIIAGIFILIYLSALIVQRFDTEILRGLEGYWYPGLRQLPLVTYLRNCQIKKRDRLLTQWQILDEKLEAKLLIATDRAEYIRIDRALRQYPTDKTDFLPTHLGNILRAAERRPYDRYGLDAIVCWPRLWLLLPETARKDIQEARLTLNNGVRFFAWSILFLVWSIWSVWVIPLALLSAIFAYCWILDSAMLYGELIESVFDLYRPNLYQSLRFPLPTNPAEERAIGLQITEYLFRGSNRPIPAFTPPPSEKK
ncbi:MAG: hypothetical protein LH631_11585 [Alkalinema sp. CAN_BIN05]|nr:hypothetical protein [Alkalinema sp. CAN_BIN05]